MKRAFGRLGEIGFNGRMKWTSRFFCPLGALAIAALATALGPTARAVAATGHAPSEAVAPAPLSPSEARKKLFEVLFARLKQASGSEQATQIREMISQAWAHPDSPTADLLMTRAESALKLGQPTEASKLLDRIVNLYPDWGYAWRRRAQSAFAQGDPEGAMLDLSRALIVEPRDFIAMAELSELMRTAHQDKPALDMMRRALALDPANEQLRDEVEKLARQVEGRDI
jgi:tetratricopeptide (TPR) repeat protein